MAQEVVLGRKWLVACGTNIISGHSLMNMSLDPNFEVSRYTAQWKDTKGYNIIREKIWYQQNGPSSLMDLLSRLFELEATFLIDKVRALLALCRDSIEIRRIHSLLEAANDTFSLSEEEFSQKVCEEMMDERLRTFWEHSVLWYKDCTFR